MNCRKVNQFLSAYMDGELPGVEHRQIYEHLNRCQDCQREYDSLLQMKRMLGSMRTAHPALDLQTRIAYAISWEETQEANRTPDMIFMRLRLAFQEFFVTPQGLGLGLLTFLGVFAVLHQFPLPLDRAADSSIDWQKTPNSISELTVGLAPSAQERFVLPPVLRTSSAMPQEIFQVRPGRDRTFDLIQPSEQHYELSSWRTR